MALIYKLVSPNGLTTLAFIVHTVACNWSRRVQAAPKLEDEEQLLSRATREKKWTFTGDLVEVNGETEPAGDGQLLLETLEAAIEDWGTQASGAGGGRKKGELRFIAGKKADGTDWVKYGVLENVSPVWKPGEADDVVAYRGVSITIKEGKVVV